MRTTIDIDADVLNEVRALANHEQVTIGAMVSQLLTTALTTARAPAPAPFAWTTGDLGDLKVDLEDKEAVRHVLDGVA